LEGIGNIMIYLANQGKLPWSQHTFPGEFVLKADMKPNAEELHNQKIKKYEAKMKHLKSKTTLEFLCQGLPPQFLEYMNYCRRLGFEENPDYNYLINLFQSFMKELSYEDDGQFDWVTQRQKIEEKIKRDEEIQRNMAALKSIQQTTASTKGFNQKMLAQLEEEQRKQAEEEINRQSAAQDVLRKYADDAERVASLLQNAKKEHREKIEKNRQEMRIRIKQKLEEVIKKEEEDVAN
jgi:hypothetical protein